MVMNVMEKAMMRVLMLTKVRHNSEECFFFFGGGGGGGGKKELSIL